MSRIVIDPRYCGPPRSGNGGYTAGLLARHVDGAVEVTLRRPPPLGRPLQTTTDGRGAGLFDGDTLIAEAHPTELALEIPPLPDLATAAAADGGPDWWPGHPFPGCFVCGPDRAERDGLRIFPGPLGDLYATTWTPHAGADELAWCALDCPSAAPLLALPDQPSPVVLGRLAAELRAPLRAETTYVVAAWFIARDGRKFDTGSALADADGTVVAAGHARWIAIAG